MLPDTIRNLFPHTVGIGVRTAEDSRPLLVPPEEARLISSNAAERRRVEFRMGRVAAHEALAELGVECAVLGRSEHGEPAWPADVIGSITHTRDTAIAVVGLSADYRALGIDLENLAPPPNANIARHVCTAAEREWVGTGAGSGSRLVAVFSAKEAIFKALFPLGKVRLNFSDAELKWNDRAHAFDARLFRGASADFPPDSAFQVRCHTSASQVFTAVALGQM